MAKVLILSVAMDATKFDAWSVGAMTRLLESAAADKFQIHSITNDPQEADAIIFAELNGQGAYSEYVRMHPYVKIYREKCFLFDPSDLVIPFLPGIYASIEQKYYQPERTRSGFYLSILNNDFTEFIAPTGHESYLFSFIGSTKNAPVRHNLLRLNAERSYFLDTSDESLRIWMTGSVEERERFWSSYCDAIKNSKFVLCPRGVGASSVRLFETMKMGRVPVILSDAWVPPQGPQWSAFSIRIAEKDYHRLPEVLLAQEEKAPVMGLAARAAWVEWFSEEVCFHRVVEWCLDIKRSRTVPESLMRLSAASQLLRPFHFVHYLRTRYKFFQQEGRLVL